MRCLIPDRRSLWNDRYWLSMAYQEPDHTASHWYVSVREVKGLHDALLGHDSVVFLIGKGHSVLSGKRGTGLRGRRQWYPFQPFFHHIIRHRPILCLGLS